jgi:hypothetical protein
LPKTAFGLLFSKNCRTIYTILKIVHIFVLLFNIKTMSKKINQKVLIATIFVASFLSFLFVNSQKGFSINSKTPSTTELMLTEVREDAEKSKKLTVPALSAIEKMITIVQKLVPGN